MDKKFVIGVDGGNSKTDYFLFDTSGNFIDHLKDGTCSHERFPDAYESSYRLMDEKIKELLRRNGIALQDVAAGAFGLAGVDVPIQQQNLTKVIEKIGFTKFEVDNDSYLGIKAGTSKGYGVCSINGSGTVTGGIGKSGKRLQVGGIGSDLSGDEAGGFFLARKTVRAVYDSLYRMGPFTVMTEPVMRLLGVKDKYYYIQTVSHLTTSRALPVKELIRILFSSADADDNTAMAIVENTSLQLAKSTAGCINNLDFDDKVEVILAGSVWVNAETPLLFLRYKEYLSSLISNTPKYLILQIPPATGAILWALELVYGKCVTADIKLNVITSIKQRV